MRGRVRAGLTIPLLLSATPLAAQAPEPRIYFRGDLPVAEQTTNNQGRASVAAGADGEYLVVWNSDAQQPFYSDIKAQRFNRSGEKIDIEFQVDQAADNRIQFTPRVTRTGNGRYIAVWADFSQTVDDSEIRYRIYDALGAPLTNALQLNTFTTGQQRLPSVAGNATGNWVAIWESEGQDGDGWGIVGQRFDANDNKVGPEFVVNSIVEGDQYRPAVAYSDAGTFVVTWDGYYASYGVEVLSQQFDANGPVGPPIPVSASSPGDQKEAVVAALEANAWAFAYRDQSNIVMRQYRNGVLGGRILVSGLTPGAKGSPRISHSSVANVTAVAWHCFGKDDPNDPAGAGVSGQLYQLDDNLLFREKGERFQVNAYTTGFQWIPDVSVAEGGQIRLTWQSEDQDLSLDGVFSAIGNDPVARDWAVDTQASGGTSNQNGVAELLERIMMIPRVRNSTASPLIILSATIVEVEEEGLTEGHRATATIDDGTADYGAIPPGTTADCFSTTGDCYEVTITGPRPAPHYDEAFRETLSTGLEKPFLLHIGESFADVPTTNPFYAFIENLFHNGVTAGGACSGYCPTDGVKRQQMAVFLLKSRFGAAFTPPPASGTIFGDVPASNPFAAWIELLYLLGVTGGCQTSPLLYCPDAIVNRQQMAVFLLKTEEGSAYTPPACTGVFQDVLCTNPFSAWIEELYARQVTGGCVASPLQYCPTNPTNRQQMAAFLVKTFGLLLYGP